MKTKEEMYAELAKAKEARELKLKERNDAIEMKMLEEGLKLVELEATHGIPGIDIEARFAGNTGKLAVVGKPPSVMYDAFLKKQDMQTIKPDDNYDLVKGCLKYPSLAELNVMIAESPAIITELCAAAMGLAGKFKSEIEKK